MRLLVPAPHSLSQAPQADHIERMQWTGHGTFWLHVRNDANAPHALPPHCGCCVTVLVRTSSPPPHDREQTPSTHDDIWQSISPLLVPLQGGQMPPWQLASSLNWGQSAPDPDGGVVMFLKRVLTPPCSHFPTQGPHAAKPVTTQSTGQAWWLHVMLCCVSSHCCPPKALATDTFLHRFRSPCPQLTGHPPQALQSECTQ